MIGVERSLEVPASLQGENPTYSGQDVRDQLIADFHGKCWLCERKLTTTWDVDHLRPKTGQFEDER